MSNRTVYFLAAMAIGATCIMFLYARAAASLELVAFDEFYLWLLGLVPLIAYRVFDGYVPVRPVHGKMFGFGASMWLVSLVIFVTVSRFDSNIGYLFDLYSYVDFNLLHYVAYVSVAVSVLAGLILAPLARFFDTGLITKLAVLIANPIFFAVLLFGFQGNS